MLINTVKNTIKEYNMINKGDKIFVALSGGADSVCLLCALNSLKEELGITLEAIHINHCIRGTESDSDEDFCLSLCRSISVRIHTYRIDIPKLSQVSGKSLEETARDARYEKFSETAGKTGKIATAHTLSDNAETVIFNMVGGSGLKGLCGIPAVRDNIIRPLAAVTRKQIEEYLKEIDIRIYSYDSPKIRRWKKLCAKELDWCQSHQNEIEHLANELYKMYISKVPFKKRDLCLNFPLLEKECNKGVKF